MWESRVREGCLGLGGADGLRSPDVFASVLILVSGDGKVRGHDEVSGGA